LNKLKNLKKYNNYKKILLKKVYKILFQVIKFYNLYRIFKLSYKYLLYNNLNYKIKNNKENKFMKLNKKHYNNIMKKNKNLTNFYINNIHMKLNIKLKKLEGKD
jgi:hypothetical protein